MPEPEKPTSVIFVKIDSEIHRQFKALCALDGCSLSDRVIALIANEVARRPLTSPGESCGV